MNNRSGLKPEIGQTYEYTRTFTRADIKQFADLTGDNGEHHVSPNKRVMAQGLLVASLVTKIGGDMNYVARDMSFEILQPVYEGEFVTGRLTIVRLQQTPIRIKLGMLCECLKPDGSVALKGTSNGHILNLSAEQQR